MEKSSTPFSLAGEAIWNDYQLENMFSLQMNQ